LARASIVFGRVLSAVGLAGLDDHACDDTPTNIAQGLNREDQHRSETDFSDFVRKFQQGEVFPYREQLRKNTGKLRLTVSTLLGRCNARISTRKRWCDHLWVFSQFETSMIPLPLCSRHGVHIEASAI
jgi:hypothetical protein